MLSQKLELLLKGIDFDEKGFDEGDHLIDNSRSLSVYLSLPVLVFLELVSGMGSHEVVIPSEDGWLHCHL